MPRVPKNVRNFPRSTSDSRQDDAEQNPVRIHAGALVAVSAARNAPRTMTLPSVFQTIPATAERAHGRHSRARTSSGLSGSMPALRSPSPPSGSRPGDDAAVRLPDHPDRRRAYPWPPQPRQDVTEQKPVRIRAGAQISVTAARNAPG